LKKGLIIGIEGIDASGKRTQSSLLESWLREKGIQTKTLSFPDYKTYLGIELKRFFSGERSYSPRVRHMLLAANRWEKREEIENYLSEGIIVIMDRYTESNLVYGVANGLPLDWLIGLEEGLPRTNLVIVLDAPTRKIFNRKTNPKDKYEENLALQERARTIYLELAKRFRWVVIDGGAESQTVHKSVVKAVAKHLSIASDQTI